jgi:GTP-binding protein LepA
MSKLGDTITHYSTKDEVTALAGYIEPKPMVFCGLYPSVHTDFNFVRTALEKLQLNDPSFTFYPEHSDGLGPGYRCGFLGLLHMEIVQERLEREFNVDLIQTAPTVTYKIITNKNEELMITSPSELPPEGQIKSYFEPIVELNVIVPAEYVGTIMQLCMDRRGTFIRTEYLSEKRVMLTYRLPLAEIIYDFYDNLKSATRGYGTMDYNFHSFEEADLVLLRILVNGAEVDALSLIVHRSHSARKGRYILQKLQKEIPRHMFQIPLQATIGAKIIARENISALRKNVTSKCYGGDVTRKRKLLDKQKEGKKRMKTVGNVEIPQKAFMSILETPKN